LADDGCTVDGAGCGGGSDAHRLALCD